MPGPGDAEACPWISPRSTSRRRTPAAHRPAPSGSRGSATAAWSQRRDGSSSLPPATTTSSSSTPGSTASALPMSRRPKGWSAQLDDLAAFAGADVLVAHNAGFDMSVIRRACAATGDDARPTATCAASWSRASCTTWSPTASPRSPRSPASWTSRTTTPPPTPLACAHIMIDAAGRAGAADLFELAATTGVRMPRIKVPATVAVAATEPAAEPALLDFSALAAAVA